MASERVDAIEVAVGHYYRCLTVSASPGSVWLMLESPGEVESIHLGTPELRDRFARAWMEACRRADGEPPATEARDDAPTQAEVDRCGYSEDPFHRCRVCYDYAAGRERDHPLTAREAREHG